MSHKINPFDHSYFLGYINQVSPQFARVHFPTSVLLNGFTHLGQDFNGGLVGAYVVIEGDRFGYLGRLTELSIPESERLSLNEKAFQTSDFHPTGKIEILLSFDLYKPFEITMGLDAYPNIGAKVFVSSGTLVQEYLSAFGKRGDDGDVPLATLGRLISNPNTTVSLSLQAIFGRHCAVVGTTGGGKSFTVSKLTEALVNIKSKIILVDATGEYKDFGEKEYCQSVVIGEDSFFHYRHLTVSDLFVLLRPAGQVQQPILLEAIQSLKIVDIAQRKNRQVNDIEDGIYIKNGRQKKPFVDLYKEFSSDVEKETADFDILKLAQQLRRECVYDSANFGNDITKWGDIDRRKFENSTSLFLRTETLIQSPSFKGIFGFDKSGEDEGECASIISHFLEDETKYLLRIGFEKVGYEFQSREILANSLGRYLLLAARNGEFKEKPLTVFVDEAHQFLNKTVKDEYFHAVSLDAFDSIAKECRKHGLFICLATQMPRDIPIGTLSQMGTFIVHRLINHNDKEAVINACSSANRNTLEFLPVLGEGEAILTGVDFPMPIIMKFDLPTCEPNSRTPKFANQ